MSIQAIAEVLELELNDSSVKFVLLGLANHTSVDRQCFPSVRTLMRYTGLSESAVRASIKRAEELGLLRVVRRKSPENPKQNLTSLYYLTLPPSAAAGEGGPAATPPSPGSETTPGPAEEGRTVTENRKESASDARASLDEGWSPPLAVMADLERQYRGIDVRHQLRLFIARSRSNQTVHRDPVEAFKAWMLRTRDLKVTPSSPPAASAGSGGPEPPAAAAMRLEAEGLDSRTRAPEEASKKLLKAARMFAAIEAVECARRCADAAKRCVPAHSWDWEQAETWLQKFSEEKP